MFKFKGVVLLLFLILNFNGCATADDKNSLKKEIQIGMSKQEVSEILGEPTKIRTSQQSKFLDSMEEAWHYDKPFFSFRPKVVVIFKNDVVNDVDYVYK